MNQIKKGHLKFIKKITYVCVMLASGSLAFSQELRSVALDDWEIDRIEESPNIPYAYVSEQMRTTVLSFYERSSGQECNVEMWEDLYAGANSVEYGALVMEVATIVHNLKQQQDKLSTIDKALMHVLDAFLINLKRGGELLHIKNGSLRRGVGVRQSRVMDTYAQLAYGPMAQAQSNNK